MQGPISGITKTSLWGAWKEVRKQLRGATVRDVVDFLEYDVDPDIWIGRLLLQVKDGFYEPQTPLRFALAKSGGFKRRLTIPAIPDIVLFRAISNFVHQKALRQQQPHVYYRRVDLQRAKQAAIQSAGQGRPGYASIYRFTSKKSFQNWQEYEQYRKQLVLRRIHRFIVISDVTNFFDSVLHSEVSNAMRAFPIPQRLIGLLFFLLERLAIRADYSDSPRIGLPVDEFECSRTIANLVLFRHDREMVARVGAQAYVRWMDDQAIGVNSRSEGLKVVSAINNSLANLYLTANAKKTRVLSLKQAKAHFHLESNTRLDTLHKMITSHARPRLGLVRQVAKDWRLASRNRDHGEWEKIQKRYYTLAGLTKAKFLRARASRDLLSTPTLTERIADYMRCSGSIKEYVNFVQRIRTHKDQVHEDVEYILIESLLRLEATGARARYLSQVGFDILDEVVSSKRSPFFAAPACLLAMRFGGRQSRVPLRKFFTERGWGKHTQLIRSSAIAYSTYGRPEFLEVRRAAAFLLNNPLALMVRMVRKIQSLDQVPGAFKARLNLRRDPVSGRFYLDMRTYTAARLLKLNNRKAVHLWLLQWARQMLMQRTSNFDRRLIKKLIA